MAEKSRVYPHGIVRAMAPVHILALNYSRAIYRRTSGEGVHRVEEWVFEDTGEVLCTAHRMMRDVLDDFARGLGWRCWGHASTWGARTWSRADLDPRLLDRRVPKSSDIERALAEAADSDDRNRTIYYPDGKYGIDMTKKDDE